MTRFRPCIDLHDGKVKQIVGGSLRDDGAGLRTNFESDRSAAEFAALYRADGLTGGHIIQLVYPAKQNVHYGACDFLQIQGGRKELSELSD